MAGTREDLQRCLQHLKQLAVVAAAVSPTIEALVDAGMAAGGASRAQVLRAMRLPVPVAGWARQQREQLLANGTADQLALLQDLQHQLDRLSGQTEGT
jgi:hypothetical protein